MNLHELINASLADQLADIRNHGQIRYSDTTIFHCYWDKELGANQAFSLMSCYITNIRNTSNKIILWVEEYSDNPIISLISRYCEIRKFDHLQERKGTAMDGVEIDLEKLSFPSFYSDYIRLIMLSRYGGVWFDLDIMFFKRLDYLLDRYESFLPTWGRSNHPNNCIFWIKKRSIVERLIERFILHGNGYFGMQDPFDTRKERQWHFSLESDLDLTILPCGWFDPIFISEEADMESWFVERGDESFYDNAYCYHWHNRNHLSIEKNSPFYRCIKRVLKELDIESQFKETGKGHFLYIR